MRAGRGGRIFTVAVPNAVTRDYGLDEADLVLDSLADLAPDELLARFLAEPRHRGRDGADRRTTSQIGARHTIATSAAASAYDPRVNDERACRARTSRSRQRRQDGGRDHVEQLDDVRGQLPSAPRRPARPP